MNNVVTPPVYAQIAHDIANRIASGELKENTKILGRSVMSSEYGVSPETIRRSFKLLADMKIVEVQKNSGVVVISKEKAKDYMINFKRVNDYEILKKQLEDLTEKRNKLNEQIEEIINQMFRLNKKSNYEAVIHQFEVTIPRESWIIGKTINEVMFWQNTHGTVLAIKRNNRLIMSPGPYAVFEEGDVFIVTGEEGVEKRIEKFISQK
ncbi:GntR family transcriptional regulator [Sporanaerobium hydrogeniformans]|uniref:GntR family transcriptional regulator n=1 Tax=Sporanaerobium hydrogeniformans TaxID=3072179 RepID=A0AC61DBD4_9FIRM|nr:TrkA C-terminal domain-containing protein [Sporanaerobium hydrogeniformans]PHV69902.1 GntR family transcriptional regulator [Sporanaerobium hydrogeniformans]